MRKPPAKPQSALPGASQSAPQPASPDQLLEAIQVLVHQVRRQLQQSLRESEHALTPLEARAIHFFARHPGATLADLVDHAGRDKGQLARLVQGLKARGLLLPEPDAQDRRIVRLTLSDAAQAHHAAAQRLRRRVAQAAAAGLDEPERRQLLTLLARMSDNLGERGL